MNKVDIDPIAGQCALLQTMNWTKEENGVGLGVKSHFLLVSSNSDSRPNVMTCHVWSAGNLLGPKLIVFVQPSNYTHDLLMQNGEFSLNVPRPGMEEVIQYCGTVSGRDENKFETVGLTPISSRHILPPIIKECGVHFECSPWQWMESLAKNMSEPLLAAYRQYGGTYHSAFIGSIEAVYADANIAEILLRPIFGR